MPKLGILHDYDLMANAEPAARNSTTCAICDASPITYQWSDYSGEAMCTRCGCAYQLKWGTESQKQENNYPYLTLKEDFIPIARKYWTEQQAFVCYGVMMGCRPGERELVEWLKVHHPERLLKK